ncbi:hypothetical protein QEH59_17940 [Coraliomargarita sp. SDUM461004]|uniref:DUF3108 domain-containing protein n=1 Tax=Thalassobacterium sedimentorum TaxID=3041258 RepID=A0ABU1ANF3_9BACT|nr:hypothetical protein [Coraliomargarita sp. SDUM461004]MDQ8196322.1 hypothetical protein [Coraliomargarita sp. SDUM461004]
MDFIPLKFTPHKGTAIALLLLNLISCAFAEIGEYSEPIEAVAKELNAQEQKEAALLAAPSDTTSLRLLNNNIAVIGLNTQIEQVTARGTFTYGKKSKDYKLVETSDGQRALIIKWTYMGRTYTDKTVSIPSNYQAGTEEMPNLWRIITKAMPDKHGQTTEERIYLKLQRGKYILQEEEFGHTVVSNNTALRRKELTYEQWQVIAGGYGERSPIHFQTVPLFLHDFYNYTVTGCRYIGTDKVGGRDTYVIQRGSDSFYYIDKEKSLLLKWGREEYFGGKKIEVSYIANSFKRRKNSTDQILLPSRITITTKGEALGTYTVDHATINKVIDYSIFIPPEI